MKWTLHKFDMGLKQEQSDFSAERKASEGLQKDYGQQASERNYSESFELPHWRTFTIANL